MAWRLEGRFSTCDDATLLSVGSADQSQLGITESTVQISLLKEPSTDSQWSGWHILTVAESGFSMLDIYGNRKLGVEREVLKKFEEKINSSGESGSLHPSAPLSAIPKKFFRELSGSRAPIIAAEFKEYIEEFISVNETTIRAERVLVEFHVSPRPVPVMYIQITETAFRARPAESVLKQVVIAV